jgi:LysM repeat protein
MCNGFGVGNDCKPSATSTVPESEQKFSSTSLSYSSGAALRLSSTTYKQVELNVEKTTSTSTPNTGVTYWGIAVPISITLAGSYKGLNTFTAVTAEASDW